MKQSIYDLLAAATSGPFGFRYKSAAIVRKEASEEAGYATDGGGSIGHILVGPDKPLLGRDVLAHMRINRNPEDDARHRIDTFLLAHCRNQLPRLLAAVKAEREAFSKARFEVHAVPEGATDDWLAARKETDAAIKAAEEVDEPCKEELG